MKDESKGHVVFAVTDAVTADAFLKGHIRRAIATGFGVSLVASPSPLLHSVGAETGVPVYGLRMARAIRPIADAASVLAAVRLVRNLRPTVTHVGTPKAALVVGIAAWLCRVPQRIYTVHGMRLDGVSGWRRMLLWLAEWISCACATEVVSVSPSLAARMQALRLRRVERTRVFGAGSISGVDHARFAAAPAADLTWSVPTTDGGDRIAAFVGRLAKDKGIDQLAAAWPRVQGAVPSARLVVVGELDVSDPPDSVALKELSSCQTVLFLGSSDRVEEILSLSDLLVLPTRREGLPVTVLEAAAAGVPAVATAVTGCVDAVVDGETGILVSLGSPDELANAMIALLEDDVWRRRLGRNAAERARVEFAPDRLFNSYAELYRQT